MDECGLSSSGRLLIMSGCRVLPVHDGKLNVNQEMEQSRITLRLHGPSPRLGEDKEKGFFDRWRSPFKNIQIQKCLLFFSSCVTENFLRNIKSCFYFVWLHPEACGILVS